MPELKANEGDVYKRQEKLGIGQPIALAYDLYTAGGNLPDEDDMQYTGALANLAIGQGELLMTPVHVARLAQCVASGGVVAEPVLVLGLSLIHI